MGKPGVGVVDTSGRGESGADAHYPAATEASSHERQLTRGETVFWYGLAAVTYMVASIWQKSLLNWFVGPAWLVAFVWFGPALTDRLRAWRRGRRTQAE